ncbi:BNR/Asp-box repeat protein [Opitutaceae bacterium TAV1]|nr:BNR/Asp-box repeat protein [Opitutaceae bacterium TAV1]
MFLPRLLLPTVTILMSAFSVSGVISAPSLDGSVRVPGEKSQGQLFDWAPVGPGGGGRFRGPVFSPHNPDLILLSGDMGGACRTTNSGVTWEMIPYDQLRRLTQSNVRESAQQRIWGFATDPDPAKARVVFTGCTLGFMRSDDAGATWRAIPGPWEAHDTREGHRESPRLVVFSHARPKIGFAGFNPGTSAAAVKKQGARLYRTTDGGDTWERFSDLPPGSGHLIAIHFVNTSPRRVLVAAANGIYLSDDDGRAWRPVTAGLPRSAASSLADSRIHPVDMAGSEGRGVFYATFPTHFDEAGKFSGGIYRSDDGGATWRPGGRDGLFVDASKPTEFLQVATSESDPRCVYLVMRGPLPSSTHDTGISMLYRSDDGGDTWSPTLVQHPDQPGYNIENTSWNTRQWGWQRHVSGLAVYPQNPDIVLASTYACFYISKNRGRTWRQIHAPDGLITGQPGGGLQIMSVWHYYFDPHDYDHRYIASTDFSGWSATRDGTLWQQHTAGNPWNQNSYALAIDPDVKNKLWAAASTTHDIPTWKYQRGLGTYRGGVVLSTDGGRTWQSKEVNNGLPGRSVTDIWLDPRSAAGARHLWVAVPGHGAYFSDNDGRTWQQRNNGILPENLNVLRITGTPAGDRLYALTTIRHSPKGILPGALYTSADNGLTWQQLWRRPGVVFPNTLTLDPHDPRTLYLSALARTSDPDATDGGVWRSTDGGQSWESIFPNPTYAVSIDPRHPGHLYAASWARSGDGLHFSDDNGKSWRRLAGYPFWRPMNVAFDPRRADRIYVTNFGAGIISGVLKPAP